jgi:predicted  nucleic acid-binding Zn-ribbon protein
MASNQNGNVRQNEQSARVADAVKAQVDQTAAAAREGISKVAEFRDQAAEHNHQTLRTGMETAAHQARETTDRFTRTLGFTGVDAERLASQSKQNMEAVTRCGSIFSQAIQDVSRSWLELGQKQWQRNLQGFTKLTSSKSVHEFTATHGELVREGVQHMVEDSRVIAERSLRAVDEASKTFSNIAPQSASQHN